MALFTDGPPASVEELSAQDSQLLDIATVVGIDVAQKMRAAQVEIGIQLESLLMAFPRGAESVWPQPRSTLKSVVVTPPLKLWHAYRTLELFYADAYNCQLNDRYAGRRDQFHGLAQWAYGKLREIGVGMASLPVPQASIPAVTPVTGGPLPDCTYYTSMTWVNRMGEEGAASAPVDATTTEQTLEVQTGCAPTNAVGWNVYLGSDPTALVQQNTTPIAVGTTWLQFVPPAMSGARPGTGQLPNFVEPLPRLIQRG